MLTVFPMLNNFRQSGRKTFLATNSLWEYTQVVMNYLYYGNQQQHDQQQQLYYDLKWTEFFDVVIVGANKPAFLKPENSRLNS
jgi:hypothetical protein